MKKSFTPSPSKSSHSVNMVNNEGMYCNCGMDALLKTSWTKSNPGRRFWACPRYGQNGYCGHFKWADDEMCSRAKQIIPGLLSKINKLQEEIEALQSKEGKFEAEINMANSRLAMLDHEVVELKKKNRFLILVFYVTVCVFVGVGVVLLM
ncbi:hypothetical protein DH2020_035883 [Rehmannia glutinosa]|uniref:GRF-type domain-containing protein n=1 Tax=Rehmannia glutinosa TaxID=99300 RepID=A0ABR0V6C6_REHGL